MDLYRLNLPRGSEVRTSCCICQEGCLESATSEFGLCANSWLSSSWIEAPLLARSPGSVASRLAVDKRLHVALSEERGHRASENDPERGVGRAAHQ